MNVKFLKTIRENLGLTQYGLAKKLGVMPNQVANFEEKGRQMPLGMLCKIRELSGLSWEELGEMLDKEFKSN